MMQENDDNLHAPSGFAQQTRKVFGIKVLFFCLGKHSEGGAFGAPSCLLHAYFCPLHGSYLCHFKAGHYGCEHHFP